MYSEQTTSNFNAEARRHDGAKKSENSLSELIINAAINWWLESSSQRFVIFLFFFSSRLCASPATLR